MGMSMFCMVVQLSQVMLDAIHVLFDDVVVKVLGLFVIMDGVGRFLGFVTVRILVMHGSVFGHADHFSLLKVRDFPHFAYIFF